MRPTIINKFGKMQGWNALTANFLGRDCEGILFLKYSDEVKKENVKGGGKFPIGRSESDYEATASVGLYKEERDAIMAALPPGSRMQDIAPFTIIAAYELPDGTLLKDRICNAEFTNNGVDVKQGDGTISFEYTLLISHIEWNV